MRYSIERCSSFLITLLLLLSQRVSFVSCASSLATLFRTPASGLAGSCDAGKINAMISETEAMALAAISAINDYQAQTLATPASTRIVNAWRTAYVLFLVEGNQYINQVSTYVQIKDAANVARLNDYKSL